MTIVLMSIAGIATGIALEALIVALALQPYRRVERDAPASLPLSAGSNSSRLPSFLVKQSVLRTGAIVLSTGGAFALVGLRYQGNAWHLMIVATYTVVLIICSATDVLAFRVPNVITYPACLMALVLGFVMPGASWPDVVFGGLLFGGLLLISSFSPSGGIGIGSAKLAFFVGFAVGMSLVLRAMVITIGSGFAVVALLLVSTRFRSRRSAIPYAPFIAGGAMLTLLIWGTAFRSI